MRRFRLIVPILLAAGSIGGCNTLDEDVLAIDATGTLLGIVYSDRNGDGGLDGGDQPAAGVRVLLLRAGTTARAHQAVTDSTGTFQMNDVPVGDFELGVDDVTVPDSLRVVRISPATVRITAHDSIAAVIALSMPSAGVAESRSLPAGRRIIVEGVALNGWNVFGDSTVHIADASGAIRGIRIEPTTLAAGEEVRLLATTTSRDGQPVLGAGRAFVLGPGTLPPVELLSTAQAATAAGGRLDAGQARVSGATILGSETRPDGDRRLTVDDGSGRLRVLLDRDVDVGFGPYVPGALLEATGLLVPRGEDGVWQLKPRSVADLTVEFPRVSVAEARAMSAGKVVVIEGTALTGWATFGDASVHLRDGTGAIRALDVLQAQLFPGDSIRFLGTIRFQDGQPVLADVVPTVLGPGPAPLPEQRSTASAATADGGRLDAALVRVARATIRESALADPLQPTGDLRLVVDDGSGKLQVILDRDAGFTAGTYRVGQVVSVTGALVPDAESGDWRLKPRQPDDVRLQ